MTLPPQYERCAAEYWSLGAEQDFLNHLGTWAEGVKTKRLDLLNRYIQAAELRHRRPEWWDNTEEYRKVFFQSLQFQNYDRKSLEVIFIDN